MTQSSPAPTLLPELPAGLLLDRGSAPEITNETWINSDDPATLASLRGQVVLIKFWTFGCINCKRVLPHVQTWQTRYADQGLAVVSVHYPEFNHERDVDNVRRAVEELAITFPVAIDNDRVTWAAYEQRYWPTIYLVDKNGHIRYKKIGEGEYDITEAAIVTLLNE